MTLRVARLLGRSSVSLRFVLALGALGAAFAAPAFATVPVPTIEGPITTGGGSTAGAFVQSTTFDLHEVGYLEEEYFLSGTATAYSAAGALGIDGMWSATPASTAAYKTRIVVRRPENRKKFNGTVVVEWLNVSGGVDAGPDWLLAHTELIRDGFAWVGVSAQKVGVEGGPALVGIASLPLKQVNPARYGSLVHPGDSFSYDIFSQAAQSLRQTAAGSPLASLKVKRLIAAGESQSAFRLVTYADAIHPLTQLFDGYFIHSRASGAAALSEAPQQAVATPNGAKIRSDLGVPVLTLVTETDLTFLGYSGAARQADSANFRLWEVPGTSHADAYMLASGATDKGDDPAIVGLTITKKPIAGIIECDAPINSGPHHFVVSSAFAALNKWVRGGKPPKSQPPLTVTGPPTVITKDAHGNALGGVRTPQVDVPLATFTGQQPGAIICILLGTTTPFDAPTLTSLYPTHRSFVSAYNKAVRRAVKSGAILKADARLMIKWAATAAIPN